MTAQEAALKEIANSKFQRLAEFNKSSTCANVDIGDDVLFFKAQSQKSAPRRRGPSPILDVDEAGVTAKFRAQISKVARFGVRKQGGEKDAVVAELDSEQDRFRPSGAWRRMGTWRWGGRRMGAN